MYMYLYYNYRHTELDSQSKYAQLLTKLNDLLKGSKRTHTICTLKPSKQVQHKHTIGETHQLLAMDRQSYMYMEKICHASYG
jgi:hypothetical protein